MLPQICFMWSSCVRSGQEHGVWGAGLCFFLVPNERTMGINLKRPRNTILVQECGLIHFSVLEIFSPLETTLFWEEMECKVALLTKSPGWLTTKHVESITITIRISSPIFCSPSPSITNHKDPITRKSAYIPSAY